MSFAHQSGSGGGAAVLTYDNPVASAPGDAMSQGVDNDVARADHKHAREAFAVPAIVLGTAAATGAAGTLIRSDATIVAFDATVPTTAAAGDAAAAGAAAVAARRDHVHGMPAADPVAATAGFRTLGAGAQQAAAGNHSHAGQTVAWVRKTADETVNNSTTLQNDDVLLIPLAANEIWAFKAFLYWLSGTTPDIKLAFTVPTGCTLSWFAIGLDGAGFVEQPVIITSGTAQIYFGNGSTPVGLQIVGIVLNGANAGNLQLQWAQQNADPSNTVMKATSYIEAVKQS